MNAEPFRHDRVEAEQKEQTFRAAVTHEQQVEQARQGSRASGHAAARWRIAWGQLIGWLIAAAILGGLLLLLLHLGGTH